MRLLCMFAGVFGGFGDTVLLFSGMKDLYI